MQLSFSQFLQQSLQPSFWKKDWKVVYLTYAQHPPRVFMQRWRQVVQDTTSISWSIAVETDGKSNPLSQNSSFLVMPNTVHWIGNLTKIPAEVAAYNGPDKLVCLVPEKTMTTRTKAKKAPSINISCEVSSSRSMIRDMIQFLGVSCKPWQLNMISTFFIGKKFTEPFLDQIARILDYFELARNPRDEVAMHDYLPHLFSDAPVLFALTDAFWQRKEKQFYTLWDRLQPIYPVPFWIAFWSRAFWKAACLSDDSACLGKAGHFIAKNLKGYKLSDYVDIMTEVYRIDIGFKTGKMNLRPFESLFIKHFS